MTLRWLSAIRQAAKERTPTGAFAEGWLSGAYGRPAETPREVSSRYPDMGGAEVSAYLNGVEDGTRGDQFRLRDILDAAEGR